MYADSPDQPLHVGYLDDLGGTKRTVRFRGKEQNLHDLWDTGLLETEGSVKVLTNQINQEFPISRNLRWLAGSATAWANESLAITATLVYPVPEPKEITAQYADAGVPILRQRRVSRALLPFRSAVSNPSVNPVVKPTSWRSAVAARHGGSRTAAGEAAPKSRTRRLPVRELLLTAAPALPQFRRRSCSISLASRSLVAAQSSSPVSAVSRMRRFGK